MNQKLYSVDIRKIFIAIPLVIIFLSNIFITQIKGLAFIGEIAVIAGLSSLGAIFIGHRADVEILANEVDDAIANLCNGLKGMIALTVTATPFLIAAYYLQVNMMYISIAALTCALALNDMLSSFFLRRGNLYSYSILRSFPSIILAIIVIFMQSPELSWIFSYLISLIILLLIIYVQLRSAEIPFKLLSINTIRYLIGKLIPTITALICATGTVLWLIIITNKAGTEAAGIWSNVYRIFSLPLIFLTATYLPLVLLKMGDLKTPFQKINETNKFSVLFFFVSLVILLIASQWGSSIFSILTGSNEFLVNSLLLSMIMFAVLKNFIGYHQSTFQVLKIDFILFGILILEIIFALLLFQSSEGSNLEYIASYIFMSVGICALILFLVILSCTSKYFFNHSK
tara:strand:- start:6959 stop:8158 length:1200 start_codon:yes stop_codon:yes gene_type:complete